jgi:hypothetical protein
MTANKIKNVYDKIMNEIQVMKTLSERSTKENAQQLNVFAFIGHGVINEKD